MTVAIRTKFSLVSGYTLTDTYISNMAYRER
jgi:hypothetical protein